MKKLYSALFVIISLISFNCQRELNSPGGGNSSTSVTSPITATLQGNILDENGQPANGVTITVGSKSTMTNAAGYFRIVNAALDKNASLVTAEKAGYFKAYRTFCATSGANQVVIKLLKKNLAGSVSSSSGGEVTLANGSKISLPANGIVTSTGSNYSGTINIYSTFIDPTAADIYQTIPGSLMADDKNSQRVVLTSFGMMAVELESAAGEKLQIATGSTATLTMQIPASIQASAPATISLWYLDPNTGIWKEEGTATKNGNVYVGQVKHFSFWNCDAGGSMIQLSMTLHTPDGAPLVHTLVRLTRPNGSSGYGWTDSLGQVSGLVPSNEALVLDVLAYPCNTVIYSQNIGPFTQNTNLGIITVQPSTSSIVTITGKLLNCSGAPVSNGYAIIYYDNLVHYAATNSTGDFSTNFAVCSGGPTTCDILGVDNTAQQQGTNTTVTLVAPLTNAGNISACGNSAVQFFNYTLDGTNYVLTSANGDSIHSYSYGQGGNTSSNTTFLSGYNASNKIHFYWSHNGAAGTFPLLNLGVQAYDSSTTLIQPFNINITTYPSIPGQFYEGNFTGQFTHPSTGATVHNINCTFKVRR